MMRWLAGQLGPLARGGSNFSKAGRSGQTQAAAGQPGKALMESGALQDAHFHANRQSPIEPALCQDNLLPLFFSRLSFAALSRLLSLQRCLCRRPALLVSYGAARFVELNDSAARSSSMIGQHS